MPKNHRKIPPYIQARLGAIQGRFIQACVSVEIPLTDIGKGKYRHLRLSVISGELHIPQSFIPDPARGKYCQRNIYGLVVKRVDLPKEEYEITFETPNYGDWSKGSHYVTFNRERYIREFIPPYGSMFEITQRGTVRPNTAQLRIVVSDVLDREGEGFEDRLLHCINLLMENVEHCDVSLAGSTFDEYSRTLRVEWEILPPGTAEEAISRIYLDRKPTETERRSIQDRFVFFQKLNPINIIVGSSGFQRYIGALLNDSLVVFENITYGNAIYVMFNDWKRTSQLSRLELLSGRFGTDFERVIHRADWKKRVLRVLSHHGHRTTS
jgi:hypothetical protein